LPARVVIVEGPEFARAEAALLKESRRFQRRVSAAAGRGVDRSYKPALVAAAPQYMPDAYAAVLTPNLQLKTTVRFAGLRPGVSVTVSSPTGGTKGGRDVRALEQGTLRHPLFGNKNFWYRTRVKPRWAELTMRATRPAIVHEIDAELEAVKRDVEAAA
jgi:hypothetical protein